MKQTCILFAGPVGSGKSPITNYLSYKLNLPVFNNDIIRTEVKEDLLKFDNEEYEKRRTKRLKEIIDLKLSFIYDASIDRRWKAFRPQVIDSGYQYIIVSLDFSKEKLVEIYKAKGYAELDSLDRTFADHQLFLSEFKNDISVSISDYEFEKRLEVALNGVSSLLERKLQV